MPAQPYYSYKVVNAYPHDPKAFTQGLVFDGGVLYESTGLEGRSSLRRVNIETGEVLQIFDVPDAYFAEGIALVNDEIFQLTWRSQKGFVYDKTTFEVLREFSCQGEGWGLTYDGSRLIQSDGTGILRFLDPGSLLETGRVSVTHLGLPIANLNELEYVEGEVYANLWQEDRIARIDPATGRVLGFIGLAGLLKPEDHSGPVDVLNGIAYDSARKRLYVTGKLWPKLFEIEMIPSETGGENQ